MPSSVIASSALPMPEAGLHGYALVGPDIVLGSAGQAAYGNVPSGGDGAYVSSQVLPSGEVRVGTDASGYAKLYLYLKDGDWAVAKSLIDLAEFVAGRGWKLSVNRVQLQTPLLGRRIRKPHLLTPGMIAQQLLSRETAFKEICLLLPDEEIVVAPGVRPSMRFEKRAVTKQAENYQDALSVGIQEFVGRLRAMINSDFVVTSDITGGRDSRVILAGLMRANQGNMPIGNLVNFKSGEHALADWRIVEPLSEKYALNVNRGVRADAVRVDPDTGYKFWRSNDLGVYSPIYPVTRFSRGISLTGAAGGVHRSVYKDQALEKNILARRNDLVSNEDVSSLAEMAKLTVSSAHSGVDDNLTHFRLFRNRFHGGRNAVRSLSIAPLASQAFQAASNLLSHEHLVRAQFFADVMMNLSPELAAEPYDSEKKGWDERHRADVTEVEISSDYEGTVFGTLERPKSGSASRGRRSLDPYCEAFDNFAGSVISSGLLPSEYVYGAGFELHQRRDQGFEHAINGAPAATVIFAGEVLKVATP